MKFLDRPNEPALDAVVEEAKRMPAPELDWDRMQTRLWQAIDREAAAPQRSSLRFLWAIPALAAAAAALFLVLPKTSTEPSARLPMAAERAEVDGDLLSKDELLQAGPAGLRISHAGRAEWTLEPDATASVLEHGGIVRIRLVSGALKAHVIPTLEKERFVVEAAGTRVAVHGTVFRVALDADRSVVDVEEGVVAVGSLDAARTSTTLLRAPVHAEFALTGAPLDSRTEVTATRGSARPGTARRAHVPSSALHATLPSEPSAAPVESTPAELNTSLTIGEVEAGVSQVVGAVTRCFREGSAQSGNLRVSAKSAITLAVAASGNIEKLTFAPPLSPSVQSCSERELLQIHFAPAKNGTSVTRVLELSR